MCKFFSCIIDKDKKVYWKRGVDSHSDLVKLFKLKEPKLPEPPTNKQISESITWAKIEISPKNDNFLVGPNKKHWSLNVDENIKPIWWNKSYEKPCWDAWKRGVKIYDEFNFKEAKNPIHPFKIKAPAKITKRHINLVKKWDSVRDSVGDSVGDSVWESVWDSVGDSVWESVWDSVRDSVRDSVGASVWGSVWDSVWGSVWGSVWDSAWGSVWDGVMAYTGSLFPEIKRWNDYIDYRKQPFNKMKKSEYPFASSEKLWKMGLVPVKYQDKWSLFGSPKGDGKIKELWREE